MSCFLIFLEKLTDLSVSDPRTKTPTPSIKTLDQFSIDELYDYLFRVDPNLILVAEKLRSAHISGLDLLNFREDDYKKFCSTLGEEKKLQLLIELKQPKSTNAPPMNSLPPSNVSDSVHMQNEITRLQDIIQKQEQDIEEKNSTIQQLEDIVERQDQQTQLQDAIIKQLQETLDKQSEEMRVLIELTQQYRSLTSIK